MYLKNDPKSIHKILVQLYHSAASIENQKMKINKCVGKLVGKRKRKSDSSQDNIDCTCRNKQIHRKHWPKFHKHNKSITIHITSLHSWYYEMAPKAEKFFQSTCLSSI